MKLDQPIRIYHKCLNSSKSNAIVKFFYVKNLIIDPADSEQDKVLEYLAKAVYIERNSTHHKDIHILMDANRQEGEQIILNYE